MRKRLSPVRGWRRRFGTEIIARLKAHTRRDAGRPKRIPPEPQLEQQKDRQNTQQRIPTLCSTTSVFGLRTGCGASSLRFGCRKTSNIVEHTGDCRNMLKYVEISRKLSNRWPRANNTRKRSSNGLPKPGTASHNGAGKSPRPKLARFAPFGPRSKPRLPMAKAWRASGSGSKRMAESSSQCKAWAPTLHASDGRKRPNQFRQLSLLPRPHQAKARGRLPTRTPRTTFGKAPRKNAGSSIRPVLPTKAS
jgi:hypothetical protein